MLENAGMGGVKAAPIAGKVMQKYLQGEMPPKIDNHPPEGLVNNSIMH
jgi:hypothetical protein